VLSEFNKDQALNPEWPKKFEIIDETEEVQIIIQINGKLRSKVDIKTEYSKEDILKLVKNDNKVKEHMKDKEIIKTIYIPNKLINFVIK
jgi:leucyl-tRNA synthetase